MPASTGKCSQSREWKTLTTFERADLVKAVLRSRDELDVSLDTHLLEAIVNAEANAAGDAESAIRAIDAAVTAAVARGVGQVEPAAEAVGTKATEDEEDED